MNHNTDVPVVARAAAARDGFDFAFLDCQNFNFIHQKTKEIPDKKYFILFLELMSVSLTILVLVG